MPAAHHTHRMPAHPRAPAPPPGSRSSSGAAGAWQLAVGSVGEHGAVAEDESALTWHEAALIDWEPSVSSFRASLDGTTVGGSAVLTPSTADDAAGHAGTVVDVFVGGESASVLVMDVAQQAQQRLSASAGSAAGLGDVLSPMPGKIVQVLAHPHAPRAPPPRAMGPAHPPSPLNLLRRGRALGRCS
jgi:hypothetical protein